MPICGRTLKRQVFVQSSPMQLYFLFGGGEGVFWEGTVLRGRHKGLFGEVGGGNNVVCLKTRTLYLGEEMFMGGGGSFMGEI